ncbi:MAG: hypothetical protein AAF577_11820 [Pseudomonadota bacterium]
MTMTALFADSTYVRRPPVPMTPQQATYRGRKFTIAMFVAPFIGALFFGIMASAFGLLAAIWSSVIPAISGNVSGSLSGIAPLGVGPLLLAVFGAPVSLPSFWFAGGMMFWRQIARHGGEGAPSVMAFVGGAFVANLIPTAIFALWVLATDGMGLGSAAGFYGIGLIVGLPNTVIFALLYRHLTR